MQAVEDVGDGVALDGGLEGIPSISGPPYLRSAILNFGHLGTHFVWSILNARATLFLQRLGLYKSVTAIVVTAGPFSGLFVQPLVGVLSDQCASRWGRRRPYVLFGLVGCIVALLCLAWSSALARANNDDPSKLATMLGVLGIVGIDIFVNTISAAHRAMTLDVLDVHEQGISNAWATRYSSLGSVVGFLLGKQNLPQSLPFLRALGLDQLGILCVCAVLLLLCTFATLFILVHESVLVPSLDHPYESPLLTMPRIFQQLYHRGRTLPQPIWELFVIQFFSWLSWFPVLYYSAGWVAEIYGATHGSVNAAGKLDDEARRVGSLAMLCYACTGLVASTVLPWILHNERSKHGYEQTQVTDGPHSDNVPSDLVWDAAQGAETPGGTSSEPEAKSQMSGSEHSQDVPPKNPPLTPQRRRWQLRCPTLSETWLVSQVLFVAGLLFFTCPISSTKSVIGAIVLVSVLGISWAMTQWAPFALLGVLLFSEDKQNLAPESLEMAPITPGEEEAFLARASVNAGLRADAGAVMGLHNWSIVIPQLIVSLLSSLGTCAGMNDD